MYALYQENPSSVSDDWQAFYHNVIDQVKAGLIPQARFFVADVFSQDAKACAITSIEPAVSLASSAGLFRQQVAPARRAISR